MNINIDNLKDYAHKLMFDMKEEEYTTLLKEFDVILKQMDIISKFDNISSVEAMVLPFSIDVNLREDDDVCLLDTNEVLLNVKEIENNQVKVPRVV